MGNKQGTSSYGAMNSRHRADTRAKNWSFHAMDGQRYPGLATRSSTRSDLLIGCSKGRSSLMPEAKRPSHQQVTCTRQQILKDETWSIQLGMPCRTHNVNGKNCPSGNAIPGPVNVLTKTNCPKQREMSCTTNESIHETECPSQQEPSSTLTNVLQNSNCPPQREMFIETGHVLHENKSPHVPNKILLKPAETTSTDAQFRGNVKRSRRLESLAEEVFESEPTRARDQDTRTELTNATTHQESANLHDPNSQYNDATLEIPEKFPAASRVPLSLLDFNYALKEVDPWGRLSDSSRSSVDNDDVGSRTSEESEVAEEDVCFDQSGNNYSINDNTTREDSGLGQSGNYYSFDGDDTHKDDVWFGQSGNYHSFEDDTHTEDLEFEHYEECCILEKNRRLKIENESALASGLSRESSADSDVWSVVEEENDLIQFGILNSSSKRRTRRANLGARRQLVRDLTLRSRFCGIIGTVAGNDDDDFSYQGGEGNETNSFPSESELLQVNNEATSIVLQHDTQQIPNELPIEAAGSNSADSSVVSGPSCITDPRLTSLSKGERSATRDPAQTTAFSASKDIRGGNITQGKSQQQQEVPLAGGKSKEYVTDKSAGDSIEAFRSGANFEGLLSISLTNIDLSPNPSQRVDLSPMQSLQKNIFPIPSPHINMSPISGELSPILFSHTDLPLIPFPHKYLSPIRVSRFRDLSSTPISSPSSSTPASSPISKENKLLEVAEGAENIDRRPLCRLRLDFENSPRKRLTGAILYPRLTSPQQLDTSQQLDDLAFDNSSTDKQQETENISPQFQKRPDNVDHSQSKDNFRHDIVSPNIVINTVEDLEEPQRLVLPFENNQLSKYYLNKLSCAGQGAHSFNSKVSMATSSTATTPTASDSGYGTGTSFASFDQGGRTSCACHDVSSHSSFSRDDDSLDCYYSNGEQYDDTPLSPALGTGKIWKMFEDYQWWKGEDEKDRSDCGSEEKLSGSDGISEEKLDGSDGISEEKLDGSDKSSEEKRDGSDINSEEKLDGRDGYSEEKRDGSDKSSEEKRDGRDINSEEKRDGSDINSEEKLDGSDINSEKKLRYHLEMKETRKYNGGIVSRQTDIFDSRLTSVALNGMDNLSEREREDKEKVEFSGTDSTSFQLYVGVDRDDSNVRGGSSESTVCDLSIKASIDIKHFQGLDVDFENEVQETKVSDQTGNVVSSACEQMPINLGVDIVNKHFPVFGKSTRQNKTPHWGRSLSLSAVSRRKKILRSSGNTCVGSSNMREFVSSLGRALAFSQRRLEIVSCSEWPSAEMCTHSFSPITSRKLCLNGTTSSFSSSESSECSPKDGINSLSCCESNECPSTVNTNLLNSFTSSESSSSAETPSLFKSPENSARNSVPCEMKIDSPLDETFPACNMSSPPPLKPSHISVDTTSPTIRTVNITTSSSSQLKTRTCMGEQDVCSHYNHNVEKQDKNGTSSQLDTSAEQKSAWVEGERTAKTLASKDVEEEITAGEGVCVADEKLLTSTEQPIRRGGLTERNETGEGFCADLSCISNLTTDFHVAFGNEESDAGGSFNMDIPESTTSAEIQDKSSGKIAMGMAGVCIRRAHISHIKKIEPRLWGVPLPTVRSSVSSPDISAASVSYAPRHLRTDNHTSSFVPQDDASHSGYQNMLYNQDRASHGGYQNMLDTQDHTSASHVRQITETILHKQPTKSQIPVHYLSDRHPRNFEHSQDMKAEVVAKQMNHTSQNTSSVLVSLTEQPGSKYILQERTRPHNDVRRPSRRYDKPETIATHFGNLNIPRQRRSLDIEQLHKYQPSALLWKTTQSGNLSTENQPENYFLAPSNEESYISTSGFSDCPTFNHPKRAAGVTPPHGPTSASLGSFKIPRSRSSISLPAPTEDYHAQYAHPLAGRAYPASVMSYHLNQDSQRYRGSSNSTKPKNKTSPIQNKVPKLIHRRNNSENSIPSRYDSSHCGGDSYSHGRAGQLQQVGHKFGWRESRDRNPNPTRESSRSRDMKPNPTRESSRSRDMKPNPTSESSRSRDMKPNPTSESSRSRDMKPNPSSDSSRSRDMKPNPTSESSRSRDMKPNPSSESSRSRDMKPNPTSESSSLMSHSCKSSLEVAGIPDLTSPLRSCSVGHVTCGCAGSSSYDTAPFMEGHPRARVTRREPKHLPELLQMDVCPACLRQFDIGKRRRLIDSCGHQRCFSCLFSSDICPVCAMKDPCSPPPPPPDVAQHDLKIRLGQLLADPKTLQ